MTRKLAFLLGQLLSQSSFAQSCFDIMSPNVEVRTGLIAKESRGENVVQVALAIGSVNGESGRQRVGSLAYTIEGSVLVVDRFSINPDAVDTGVLAALLKAIARGNPEVHSVRIPVPLSELDPAKPHIDQFELPTVKQVKAAGFNIFGNLIPRAYFDIRAHQWVPMIVYLNRAG